MYFLKRDLAKRLGYKEEHILEDAFERDVRRKYADWKFIEKQPVKIRVALKLFIETGDSYKAAKLAGLTIDEFEEIRIKARIPKVIISEE